MNVILLERSELRSSTEVTLTDLRAAHLRRVLGAAVGQQVRVGIVDGPLGVGTIAAVDETAVALRCAFDPHTPPEPPLDLLLALPRPKVMRRLWPQLAALGVRRIILASAGRVERFYFDSHVLSPDCYRPLLLEGLQQARDTRMPLVSIHRQLRPLIEDDLDRLCGSAIRLVADPAADRPVDAALRDSRAGRVLLAIGPEGGWNDFERSLLERHGFRSVGMGTRTLRTDTACVALLALVHDALREHAVGAVVPDR